MDQNRDLSGRQLYRLSQIHEMPEFVKSASQDELQGDEALPNDCFADQLRRHYPCHTPAATWLSTINYLEKKASYRPSDAEYIQDRLNYFTRYHGIPGLIKSLHEKVAQDSQPVEPVLADDDFALVYEEDGRKQRHYPLRNSLEVKKAAAYLHEHRDHFPYKLRRDFADKVLEKAAQHGADISEHEDFLERQAGYGICCTKTAIDMLYERVHMAHKNAGARTPLQEEMLALAKAINEKPASLHSPGRLVKLAEVVDAFDRTVGIHHDYSAKVPRPEDVLFELTREKVASAVRDHVSTITGNVYNLIDMEKLSVAAVRDALGDDFAETVRRGDRVDGEKAADIVPTLDRGMAGIFDDLMARAGFSPAAKEASQAVGLTRDYLLKMAADHRHFLRTFQPVQR